MKLLKLLNLFGAVGLSLSANAARDPQAPQVEAYCRALPGDYKLVSGTPGCSKDLDIRYRQATDELIVSDYAFNRVIFERWGPYVYTVEARSGKIQYQYESDFYERCVYKKR